MSVHPRPSIRSEDACRHAAAVERDSHADRYVASHPAPAADTDHGVIVAIAPHVRPVDVEEQPHLLGHLGKHVRGREPARDQCRNPPQCGLLVGKPSQLDAGLGVGDRRRHELGEGRHPGLRGRPERLRITWAYFTNRYKTFPIPLSDPELFTANPQGQAFIAADRLGLHAGTAGLLATSHFIDIRLRLVRRRVRQPILLMLAGQDRIVDNARTLASVNALASTDRTIIEYPEGHHTLEFEPDPTRYARDLIDWLDRKTANRSPAEGVASRAEPIAGA